MPKELLLHVSSNTSTRCSDNVIKSAIRLLQLQTITARIEKLAVQIAMAADVFVQAIQYVIYTFQESCFNEIAIGIVGLFMFWAIHGL